MVPGSTRNWIAVNAVQQSSLNKKMKAKNMTTPSIRNSISRPPLRRGFLLVPLALALAWLVFSPTAQADCKEGCDLSNGNTFLGNNALVSNTTGIYNTAIGELPLLKNTTGLNNTATGDDALGSNTTGSSNTANGAEALLDNTGSNNIGLGSNAGINLTTGKNNIDIGNAGVAGESNKIRIGTKGTQKNTFIAGINGVTVAGGVGVIIDSNGHLGTVVSSERFKAEIKPMDKASEAILALKPVTFRYKKEFDPDGILQFGLVAEEVEKVNRDLVARDEQ